MKRVFAVFLAFIMVISSVAVCPVTGTKAAEADNLKTGVYYAIVSKATKMAMTVSGFSKENSAGICQLPRENYPSQLWILEAAGDGYYRIVNQRSQKALNVPNQSEKENQQIIQYTKENGDNSKWKLTKIKDSYYRITAKHTEDNEFALCVKDASGDKSASVVQAKYTGADHQLWELIEIKENQTGDYPKVDTKLAVTSFINKFVYQENGKYRLKRCGTIWSCSESIEVILDIYERYGGEEYKKLVCDLVDWYIQNNGADWSNNHFNDDVMWAVIMCARAYLLTGTERYLTYAQNNFRMCYERAWSEDLGGGLWWESPKNVTKNACVNGPAAVAASLLGEATGNEDYYKKAKAILDWEIKTLMGSDGGIWDSYNNEKEYNKWVSSYNQGTFIGACTMLYQHYKDKSYFEKAKLAAARSMKLDLNGEQTGNDLIGFKGILARWIGYFAKNCDVDDYNEWMYLAAASAWVNRNSDHLMWTQFGTMTQEKIDTFETNDANEKNKEIYAGWGCSSAVSWLVNCTDIDAGQEKEKSRTESRGVTAAKVAYEQTLAEAKTAYANGPESYLASAWSVFEKAYKQAAALKSDASVLEIRSAQNALYTAFYGLKAKNPPEAVIEMESGECSGSAKLVDANDCSGKKYVGELGGKNKGAIHFIVTAEKAGEHEIAITYCAAEKRSLNVRVNQTAQQLTCKGGSSWSVPAKDAAVLMVMLNKGENTIVFEGVETSYAPNLDCFTFRRTSSEENKKLDEQEKAAFDTEKKSLQTVFGQAESIYRAGAGNYTTDSWNAFRAAYENAEALLSVAVAGDQELLKKCRENLEAARQNLKTNTQETTKKENTGQSTGGGGNTSTGGGGSTGGGTGIGGGSTGGGTGIGGGSTGEGGSTGIGGGVQQNPVEEQPKPEEAETEPSEPEEATVKELKKGISLEQAEKLLLSDSVADDEKETRFSVLQLRMTKTSKAAKTLKWKQQKNADGYVLYRSVNGGEMKRIKMLPADCTGWTDKSKTKAACQYRLVAYRTVDGKKEFISASKEIFITAKTAANVKALKLSDTLKTMKKGKAFQVRVFEIKGKKKLRRKNGISYESTNQKIATVTKKGKIKAGKKGSCYVYAYAKSGAFAKIKIRVK